MEPDFSAVDHIKQESKQLATARLGMDKKKESIKISYTY